MPKNGSSHLTLNLAESLSLGQEPPLAWDWDVEHEDRQRERKADAAMRDTTPFEVDRRLLKDVVREKMGIEVGRIKFLSAGEFGGPRSSIALSDRFFQVPSTRSLEFSFRSFYLAYHSLGLRYHARQP